MGKVPLMHRTMECDGSRASTLAPVYNTSLGIALPYLSVDGCVMNGRWSFSWVAALRQLGLTVRQCLLQVRDRRSPLPFAMLLAFLASMPAWMHAEEPSVLKSAYLHLDAWHVEGSTQSESKESRKPGERIERWSDRSGNSRHFVASDATRPTWQSNGEAASVRFDGLEHAMRMLQPGAMLEQATFVMVVAPHANPGDFRGLFALNAPGEKDYTSGLNVDLGPGPSPTWSVVNVEGKGFSGAKDVLEAEHRFGTPHILELRIDNLTRTVALTVDGQWQGSRPMTGEPINASEWTLGARYYTNGPGDQKIQGQASLDIAEWIVWDRGLTNAETRELRDYLTQRHAKLAPMLASHNVAQATFQPIRVADPPQLQMLQPGFTVHRLPIEITNVNNVLTRYDGTLVTLGYNGDIHLLRDTDGDGLEDQAKVFYRNQGSLRGPIGLQWTQRGDRRGHGAFVASKGKVSFLRDNDGDDVADEELVIAKGWEEITQNVDAVGLAMGPDGSLYFGLGTANYANAYLLNEAGVSAYDLKSDRGTIQRIAPDFSQRETICTGVRFPIGIAFHPDGELFCTDQEGATWLPNGNPLDELLHVQRNKHFGFPPRHPRHNPSVLDEPSVFDYGPQHQSTCGLFFNRGVDAPSRFGPESWVENAIVCGESRGKLWRTQLVSTPHGYIGQTQLIACLQMLTVDACLAGDGAMVVACHSGPPDWGTGPAGIGSLFKVRTDKTDASRPVLAWQESPNEMRIAFDRPIDPTAWRAVSSQIRIEAGRHVRAGDRFENLVPPYAVVQAQSVSPRREVPIVGVGITSDLRTMLIQVPPQTSDETYAISLPGPTTATTPNRHAVSQLSEIDVDLNLHGVRAAWSPKSNPAAIREVWLPHVDLGVARKLTAHSASHDAFWKELEGAGTLVLNTRIDLRDMLRPKVQPGSKIDYQWPEESVSLQWLGPDASAIVLESQLRSRSGAIEANANVSKPDAVRNPTVTVRFPAVQGTGPLEDIVFSIRKQEGDLAGCDTSLSFRTNEDPTLRAIPLHRFQLPWSSDQLPDTNSSPVPVQELVGGNWGRGRRLFHREDVGCIKCHTAPGSGSAPRIGPDLSNLMHRDYGSVLRDIRNPSYAINPEFIGHQIRMQDGTVLTGVLRDEGGRLILGDAQGKSIAIDRDQVETMQASASSVMPNGLIDKLQPEEIRDLMTYLMTAPPQMPIAGKVEAPPKRTAAEVAAVLQGSEPLATPLKPLRIVLVAGPKDHGPGEHDYPAWLMQWGQLLTAAEAVTVEAAWEFPSEEQMKQADVLVFFQKGSWNAERARSMDAYFERGGGAMYMHWAVNGSDQVADFSKRIGLASWGGKIRYRHGPLELKVDNASHPIMRNVPDLDLLDESYWLLTGDPQRIGLLASSEEDGELRPQLWTYEPGNGRVFVSIPGHYNWTFDDPIFRAVVLRAMAWTAREPIDRFNELVPLGARISR